MDKEPNWHLLVHIIYFNLIFDNMDRYVDVKKTLN